jgi:hypothetical protein
VTGALFSPVKLADLELANRIAFSPMCKYSANDGVADDWHMTHLGMLAPAQLALPAGHGRIARQPHTFFARCGARGSRRGAARRLAWRPHYPIQSGSLL